MKRYEHKVVELLNGPSRATSADIEKAFDVPGDDGWELVLLLPDGRFVMKRIKGETDYLQDI